MENSRARFARLFFYQVGIMFKAKLKLNSIYKLPTPLIFLMVLGVLFGGSIYTYNLFVATDNDTVKGVDLLNNYSSNQQDIGAPVQIKIPSIGVDAAIENVALTTKGDMDVPKQKTNVGWYESGPRPGEVGSAVMAGHVDWLNGATAVFTDLYKLQPGDKIFVQDNEGRIITFIVRESQRFDAAANRLDVFTSTDGRAHLNLITCEGAWNKEVESYSQRLVVFTDQE